MGLVVKNQQEILGPLRIAENGEIAAPYHSNEASLKEEARRAAKYPSAQTWVKGLRQGRDIDQREVDDLLRFERELAND